MKNRQNNRLDLATITTLSLSILVIPFTVPGCGSNLIFPSSALSSSNDDSAPNSSSPSPSPSPNPIAVVRFTNNQAASVVIGQPDFSTVNEDGPTATDLYYPWGNPTVANGILYVTDWDDSRILGYNSIPTSNYPIADFVLGQTDMESSSSGTSETELNYPWGVSASDGKFAVADYSNGRVLIYNSLPTSTNAPASTVLGKPDMTTSSGGVCNSYDLSNPASVSLGGGKLAVADFGSHRVLIWNSIPTSNYAAADLVIGQSSFTSCTANPGGASERTLQNPGDLWTDGTKLLVADSGNHRILVWSHMPTTNGQPADYVLGQSDFTSISPNSGGSVSAVGVDSSGSHWSNLSSNGRQIFYSDYNNNRVLIWNNMPTGNGLTADVVLGQPNFTSKASISPPTASSFSYVGGVTFHENQFFVTDYGNNRILIFNGN